MLSYHALQERTKKHGSPRGTKSDRSRAGCLRANEKEGPRKAKRQQDYRQLAWPVADRDWLPDGYLLLWLRAAPAPAPAAAVRADAFPHAVCCLADGCATKYVGHHLGQGWLVAGAIHVTLTAHGDPPSDLHGRDPPLFKHRAKLRLRLRPDKARRRSWFFRVSTGLLGSGIRAPCPGPRRRYLVQDSVRSRSAFWGDLVSFFVWPTCCGKPFGFGRGSGTND